VTLFAPVIETVQVPIPELSDQPVKSEVGRVWHRCRLSQFVFPVTMLVEYGNFVIAIRKQICLEIFVQQGGSGG